MIYWLIGYMWLFIHRPFEVWPWLGDLHIERVYMLLMLGYWSFFVQKTWTHNRINPAILLLFLSMAVSTVFSNYVDFSSVSVQNWLKILVFYVLLMSSVRGEDELKMIVISFVCIMALFEIHSLYEYSCGRGVYRMGIWRMIGVGTSLSDPNSFAASVNYGIPLLLPVMMLNKTRFRRVLTIGCLGIAVLCIILTGSRTGMLGLVLLMLCGALISKSRLKFFFVFFVLAIVVWGNIPEELRTRFLTLFDPSLGPSSAQGSAESREKFFWIAMDIWKANPIFGVGPDSFRYASGTGQPSHSLYAEVISCLGSVGGISLFVLLKGFYQNLRNGRTIYKEYSNRADLDFSYCLLLAVTISVCQLLFLGLGGHNLFRFTWVWYGAFSALALRFILEKQVAEVEKEKWIF